MILTNTGIWVKILFWKPKNGFIFILFFIPIFNLERIINLKLALEEKEGKK